MSPEKRVFFSFLLNKSLSKDQIRPEHLLHNTISPCAQTRRIKDIGLVLPKYYGLRRNTERKEGAEGVVACDHLYKDLVYRVNCDDTLRAIRDWI